MNVVTHRDVHSNYILVGDWPKCPSYFLYISGTWRIISAITWVACNSTLFIDLATIFEVVWRQSWQTERQIVLKIWFLLVEKIDKNIFASNKGKMKVLYQVGMSLSFSISMLVYSACVVICGCLHCLLEFLTSFSLLFPFELDFTDLHDLCELWRWRKDYRSFAIHAIWVDFGYTWQPQRVCSSLLVLTGYTSYLKVIIHKTLKLTMK